MIEDYKFEPEREFEHWKAIKETSLYIHQLAEMIAGGPDNLAVLIKRETEAKNLLTRLLSELPGKYNVIPPSACPEPTKEGKLPPPDGMTYFWAWDNFMLEVEFMVQQELTICAACSFFLPNPDRICCRVFPGSIKSLIPNNYTCAMVQFEHWTTEDWYERVKKEGAKRGAAKYARLRIENSPNLTNEKKEQMLKDLQAKAGRDALVRLRAKEEALKIVSMHLAVASASHQQTPTPG